MDKSIYKKINNMKNAIKKWLHIQTKDVRNTDRGGVPNDDGNQNEINIEVDDRVSELELKVSDRVSDNEETLIKVNERLSKIEEQLKPEPMFKAGELVNFFLVGNEFEGEIAYNDYEDCWLIEYLDKNNVVRSATIKEEDIWVDECDCIDCLQDQIEELSFRLKALENKKK
jgi:hypothetical protein